MMVMAMVAEMLSEMVDTLCHQRNLHLGRTCVSTVVAEFFDDLFSRFHGFQWSRMRAQTDGTRDGRQFTT
jgi:hypothetical protein